MGKAAAMGAGAAGKIGSKIAGGVASKIGGGGAAMAGKLAGGAGAGLGKAVGGMAGQGPGAVLKGGISKMAGAGGSGMGGGGLMNTFKGMVSGIQKVAKIPQQIKGMLPGKGGGGGAGGGGGFAMRNFNMDSGPLHLGMNSLRDTSLSVDQEQAQRTAPSQQWTQSNMQRMAQPAPIIQERNQRLQLEQLGVIPKEPLFISDEDRYGWFR